MIQVTSSLVVMSDKINDCSVYMHQAYLHAARDSLAPRPRDQLNAKDADVMSLPNWYCLGSYTNWTASQVAISFLFLSMLSSTKACEKPQLYDSSFICLYRCIMDVLPAWFHNVFLPFHILPDHLSSLSFQTFAHPLITVQQTLLLYQSGIRRILLHFYAVKKI